ncbi:MAG: hypothetical protein Q9178_005666 [Gyalolechia marmorata]
MKGRTRPLRAAAQPSRTGTRTRNHLSYQELSSGIDTDNESSGLRQPIHAQRPSRKRRRISYNEASSESDKEVESNEEESHTAARRQNGSRAPRKPSSGQCNEAPKPSETASVKKSPPHPGARRNQNGKVNKHTKHMEDSHEQDFNISQLGGKVPPWQTLPYELLLHIFQFASYPLMTETFEPTNSISWLVGSALLCKGFAEPALSALYYAPPLDPPSRVHKMLTSLVRQPETSFFNYRAKVKYLDFDAIQVLTLKYEGRDAVRLADLLAATPQLRGIGLHLLSDLPSWKGLYARPHGKRIIDEASLYPALELNNIRLSKWTWNAHLALTRTAVSDLEHIHRMDCFQTLRSLAFVNSRSVKDIERFANSTRVLPNLKDLTMQNMVLEELPNLTSLPNNLESLAVINCQTLQSSILTPLLASHGRNLKEIVLDHNNSLNLAFLPQLAASCPKLETLKMDLRFYNSHTTYRGSEPRFATLLSCEMVPTWPRTLQRIELFHLRKWDKAAADTFFSSLVNSAEQLPDLRYIDIKASVDESNWRERIKFRNEWTDRMQKVFKRSSAPPDPRLKSITIFLRHRKEFRNIIPMADDDDDDDDYSKPGRIGEVKSEDSKKFSHVQVHSGASTNISSDSDTPLAFRLRSTRLRDQDASIQSAAPRLPRRRRQKRKRTAYNSSSSSTESDSALEDLNSQYISTNNNNENHNEDDRNLFIHGMCDVVRVAIDNLRPTEEYLNESNFLDEEISGDEDWNGDDDGLQGGGGGGHAW